jgi:hypothetical protein
MTPSKSSTSKGEVYGITVRVDIYINHKKLEIWETGNLISKAGKRNQWGGITQSVQ